MAAPEWISAAGGFLVGASITRLTARIRTSRLSARLEAAEFESAQLREELDRQKSAEGLRAPA